MKYSSFIKGNEGFQYSINIQYDLMNPSKINGYIPTRKSVELLKKYLLNTLVDNRDKSTVLIGPYGKGKSHLLLVLLGLMCGNKDSEELNKLVEKIGRLDKNCSEFAEDVLSNKRFLPVVINFNSGDLNQAFLLGLNTALKNEKMEDILPNTYFDSAIEVLNGWAGYEKTINFVKKLIKDETKLSLEEFTKRLRSFDTEVFELFKKIFKQVTSGIEFNPFLNTDVVKLYEETNHLLKEKYGIDGIIIVFDEFSKFIEASAENSSAMNLKILQDFAELCSRSKSPQMHLVCITHKTINEYISKIPQEKIDAWRAIEGRFKEIFFNSSSQQNYELISNAIVKDTKEVNKILQVSGLGNNEHVWSAEEIFDYTSKEEFRKNIIEGCFPLSPYTTFALPVVSEKVAQNERTLFTYLSKDEPHSLVDLVTDEELNFDLVTLERVYDYFENLFKKETFNEAIYDVWVKVDTALKIVFSNEEKRLVKALGIIYIINDFGTLAPTEDVLAKVLMLDKEEVHKMISTLRHQNILVLRKSTEMLDFIPLSSVDIKGKITNLTETKFKSINLAEAYNELCNQKYILPRKYNDDYKMTRFFNRTFMTIDQITAFTNAERLLKEYGSDGVIIDVIAQNENEYVIAKEWLEKLEDNRIAIVCPKEVTKIKEDIAEYRAIEYLKRDEEFLKEDVAIESQLDILLEDNMIKITEYINNMYDMSKKKSVITLNGNDIEGIKYIALSEEVSDICYRYFGKSPRINSELINKTEVSTPIKKARNQIIKMLLENSYEEFDSSKNAPECTIFRATIVSKDLLKGADSYSEDIKPVLNRIKTFIKESANEERSFKDLYLSLTSANDGIGMRKGSLPIYMAYVFKEFKDDIIIYAINGRNKKEVILDYGILDNINNNPEEYILKVEEGTPEREEYIENLLSTFKPYLSKLSSNKYVDIIQGMRRWVQSLSIYAQNHKKIVFTDDNISREINYLRKELVKYELNYRGFIFNDLMKHLKVKDFKGCYKKLVKIKAYLDAHDNAVRSSLIKRTNELLDDKYKGSLAGNLKSWYGRLTNEQASHLYDGKSNELLNIIQLGSTDDIRIIDKLAYTFTSLAIEDWNDTTAEEYLKELEKTLSTIVEYEVACDSSESTALIKISYDGNDNEKVEKTFDKTEISLIGGTLRNAIEDAIEEYGDSIDDNEKRSILMDILSRYI